MENALALPEDIGNPYSGLKLAKIPKPKNMAPLWSQVVIQFPSLANCSPSWRDDLVICNIRGADFLLDLIASGMRVKPICQALRIRPIVLTAFLQAGENGKERLEAAEKARAEHYVDRAMDVVENFNKDKSGAVLKDLSLVHVAAAKFQTDFLMKMAKSDNRTKFADSDAAATRGGDAPGGVTVIINRDLTTHEGRKGITIEHGATTDR